MCSACEHKNNQIICFRINAGCCSNYAGLAENGSFPRRRNKIYFVLVFLCNNICLSCATHNRILHFLLFSYERCKQSFRLLFYIYGRIRSSKISRVGTEGKHVCSPERCLPPEGRDLLMKEIKIDQLLQVLSPSDQRTSPFTSWHSDIN